jgi:hypothetical protein
MRNEAYIEVRRNQPLRRKPGKDEGNPAVGGIDGPFYSLRIAANSHPLGAGSRFQQPVGIKENFDIQC